MARFFITTLVILFIAGIGAASATELVARDRLDEVGRGSLLLDDGDAITLRVAPLVATTVDITVSGLVARAHVSQSFQNPSDAWVEGIYVFPLPEGAAVDHMVVRIGDRVIEGRIKEREEARAIYQKAKDEGRKAGLLESERPNIFTTSIANIGPGETVTIAIDYQQVLRYDQGRFALRFPMVVGPRFIPGAVQTVSFQGDGRGWAMNTDDVSDASRITPPVQHPDGGEINPVHLRVSLDAGFPLTAIDSPYHDITVVSGGEDAHYAVTLDAGVVPADRDFELTWSPDIGAAPAAGLFTETIGGADYALIMVMPPSVPLADDERAPRIAREVIFIIDTSGSMSGDSIDQASEALALAIGRLADGDRFNVIQFNNVTASLFATPRRVDRDSRARARRYVRGLDAQGGTHMASALRRALDGDAPKGFIRQVVFLTDGAVGNEAALLGLIHDNIGGTRLFTIGIGSAPNSYFMTEAAKVGRGTYTYIGKIEEVGERMGALFEKLERPVLTDLSVVWPDGIAAEMSMAALPDLYAGEPVVFTAKLSAARGTAQLSGLLADRQWRVALPLGGAAASPGVAKLWARDRIAGLMAGLHRGADIADVRPAVAALGLRHHLVTKYTSLVAVDVSPTRPADQPLDRRDVPTNLPHGWDFEKVFGESRPATPQRDAALAVQMASAKVQIGAGAGLRLPQTATPAPLQLAVGLAFLLIGAAMVVLRRRPA